MARSVFQAENNVLLRATMTSSHPIMMGSLAASTLVPSSEMACFSVRGTGSLESQRIILFYRKDILGGTAHSLRYSSVVPLINKLEAHNGAPQSLSPGYCRILRVSRPSCGVFFSSSLWSWYLFQARDSPASSPVAAGSATCRREAIVEQR